MYKKYTLTIPADWNKDFNPTDEFELFFCLDDNGVKEECILSFPENESGDFYAQAKIDIDKAKIIVAALRTHFNF